MIRDLEDIQFKTGGWSDEDWRRELRSWKLIVRTLSLTAISAILLLRMGRGSSVDGYSLRAGCG